MDLAQYFSPDYARARQRFRASLGRLGWRHEVFPLSGFCGPQGEELSLDVGWTGPSSARSALVISSGLHGVEGPFGSAVQLAWLERLGKLQRLTRSTRLVLLHALNPYGMAYRRRFNEENVDLNRNFLFAHQAYHGAPALYAQLDPVLNPRRPPTQTDCFHLHAWWLTLRYGFRPLQQAIVQGQYDFPRSLFFGGHAPSWTQRILAGQLTTWLGASERVAHIDFHTGLGDWGTWKLLVSLPEQTHWGQAFQHWFGPESIETADRPQVAYAVHGDLGPWCVAQQPGRDYLYVCAEFGTYAGLKVLSGLRAENQAHHWGTTKGLPADRIKSRLMELFCPSDSAWRRRVVEAGMAILSRVAKGLDDEHDFPKGVLPVESWT